jgi:hypothetical protein
MGFRIYWGSVVTRVGPTPEVGAAIPAGGQKKRKPEYGLVQYPERGLVYELRLRLEQRKPTFAAHLECYTVPEAEGKIRQTHEIQVSLGQDRAKFSAGVHQVYGLAFGLVQDRQRFEATVFWTGGKEKLPKWIEDIVNREKQEQDDEDAILAILFGRKL